MSKQSVKSRPIDPSLIQNMSVMRVWDMVSPKENRDETILRLIQFGLQPFEILLLTARFYENKTFEEIVEEQKWVSISSASYHFKQTLIKLRKGGFSLK